MKRALHVYSPQAPGQAHWRSLGELHGSAAFAGQAEREFPEGASEAPSGFGRRRFISLMGASLALGGLVGCRRPEETIVPYTRAPEEVIPGRPLYFATALPMLGTAFGLIVESHEGRPTKIEGNPRHPESLGATSAFLQASVLDLYDPDRSDSPRQGGEKRTWDEAAALLRRVGEEAKSTKGRGLAILTEAHRSPTLARLLGELQSTLPEARLVRYEPLGRDEALEGARLVFGRFLETALDVAKAKVLVTLDSDLLVAEGSPLKQARGFAAGRDIESLGAAGMSRLYAVESAFSITGAAADHRLRIARHLVPRVALALARELARLGVDLGELTPALEPTAALDARAARLVKAMAADLASRRGEGLVVAGRGQPAAVHAVVQTLNHALGNVGKTVRYVAAFEAPAGPARVVELARAMRAGEVDTLLILGGNPVYDAPADSHFAAALGQVKRSIHLATHVDDTGARATWHLNRAHALESWGDLRAEEGTASIVQPLIAPIFGGRTDCEVIDLLLGRGRKAHELVRATWQSGVAALDFDKTFRRALHDGLWAGSASPAEEARPRLHEVAAAIKALPAPSEGVEITFSSDPHVLDGRFANNGWLQELPCPMHKLTWGNAAAISPAMAREHGLADGDIVTLAASGAEIRIPVLIAPGQAERSIALTLGYGRTHVGRVGTGVGVDVTPLRASTAFNVVTGVTLTKTGEHVELARTQEHFAMEGRNLAREGTAGEFTREPEFAKEAPEHPPLLSLWKERTHDGHAWGLNIDLNTCIGCNACVTACQAENNIPIVGAEGVAGTREMHWLRIDRYFTGPAGAEADEPASIAQPTMCSHCENAPCEQVCPVGATSTSPEGLNDMAYNRCIGTKYCANNCPFKVRRFNFLDYTSGITEIGKMQINPDVTVRSRGVMEKCTFCVQRINHAKIDAKKEGQDRVKDGAVVTACQQACPTQAIRFGDLNDHASKVARRLSSPRMYRLLEELNIKPRVSYLARIKNPNPALEGA
ncbi:MAG: TAT-variant-translocated molybdopterin oxidoreductase [Byssovorax sp.]